MRNRVPSALFVALALLCVGCGTPPSEQAPGRQPPDILLLVVDCLRADRLTGSFSRPATPRLDELAKEGIRFTRAFSQTNWTRPSIPSYLTGLYPSEHGLTSLLEGQQATVTEALSPQAETLAETLGELGYASSMIGDQHQLAPRFGLSQGFDHYNHKGSKAESIHFGALEWLASSERPFFTYLHYLELHWPYCPPEATRGRFSAGWEGREFCFQWRKLRNDLRSGAVVLSPEETAAMSARYDEELLALDARLGELFEELRARGLWDETLVILTSDHGEEFFEHGGMGHGTSLYDELIAVPLIVKPPTSWGAATGVDIDALVELRDLAPTILDAAGAANKGSARSLVPCFFGETPVVREFVTSEDTVSVAVRTRDLKLIVAREGGGVELYDLSDDPGEKTSVAAQRPNDVARLQGYLRRWRSELKPLESLSTELDAETVEGLKSLGYVE